MKRTDDHFETKWNGKRIVRDETTRINDPGIDFAGDPGKTDPSQARECDVNLIVDRFAKTGVLPGVDAQRMYADISGVGTFQESLNIVLRAEEQFSNLDAHVRKRFNNDPSEFLAFAENPKNAQELVNLGLATERPPSGTDRLVDEIRKSRRVEGGDIDPPGQSAEGGRKK